MTRERKIFVVLGVTAAMGLVIDQVFLAEPIRSPQTASGAATIAPSASASTAAASDAVAMSASPDMASQARSIEPIAQHNQVAMQLRELQAAYGPDLIESAPDAFEPHPSWRPKSTKKVSAALRPEPTAAQRFMEKHRLSAVMTGTAGDGYAVVGNRPIRVGEVLDGFTLVGVSARQAVFESEGLRATLKLPVKGAEAEPEDRAGS